MDPIKNPFQPSAGSEPPKLVGRSQILTQAFTTLGRIKAGRAHKSTLMVGLRGVGKTVLLHHIYQKSQQEGYKSVKVEAQERDNIGKLLYPGLHQLLKGMELSRDIADKAHYALRVLRSFLGSIKLNIGPLELSAAPIEGVADSGILSADLTNLFLAVAEAAKAKQTSIAIFIDEMQYLTEDELNAVIMAIHSVSQHSLPLVLFGAGLPQLVGKMGDAKSYAERLFDYPEIGPLSQPDAFKALQEPAKQAGATFSDEAAQEIFNQTKGYPYFIQEWGYHAWNLSESTTIDLPTAINATQTAIDNLDKSFFRVRFDRLTPREKEYMRALAEVGDAARSGEIAEKLNINVEKAAPIRNNLIKKGMIYSQAHGDTAFTVPLFADFMKRIMPEFP